MGRPHSRKDFDPATRLALAEGDIDDLERNVTAIQKSMSRVTQALIGASITLATSSILMALNLVTR